MIVPSEFTSVNSDFDKFSISVTPIFLERSFMFYISRLYYLAFYMFRKLNIFCRFSSNTVNLPVKLNKAGGKLEKLSCPENTGFDLCPMVSSWRLFVINIIKLNLDWITNITNIARRIYPEVYPKSSLKLLILNCFMIY